MPVDRERQKLVREGVEFIKNHASDMQADDDPDVRIETLAEGLALLAAQARHAGVDEGLHAEIVLKSCDCNRETLAEARHVLAALGYGDIAAVIKRLERTAPHRLSFVERMRAQGRRADRVN